MSTVQTPHSGLSSFSQAVQQYPHTLSKTLSFLTDSEKQSAKFVCKQWQKYSKPVENGYGDFILLNENGTAPDASVYKKIFPLLNAHLPQVHQKPLSDRLKTVNQLIQEKFSDAHVKAVFIPRVLYELCFLLQGAEEEIELAKKQERCKDYCFHQIIYAGPNGSNFYKMVLKIDDENLHDITISIAARLNQFIIERLHVAPSGETEEAYQEAGKKVLDRLHQIQLETTNLPLKTQSANILYYLHYDKMIPSTYLKKAIALECSKEAENALILYRGSDSPTEPLRKGDRPHCASFGESLFAGYVRDQGACAATFMFTARKVAYAILIPLKDHWQDAFDIPSTNTICGLDACGEEFHARSKCLSTNSDQGIEGYNGGAPDVIARLVSPLNESELQSTLNHYFSKRIEFINRFNEETSA